MRNPTEKENSQGREDPRTFKENSQGEGPGTSSPCDQGDRMQVKCVPQEDRSREKGKGGGVIRKRERWRDQGTKKERKWKRRKKNRGRKS